MTNPNEYSPCRTPMPVVAIAIMGAFALSGCAATHVGDAWQCPLAQGAVCSSVAAADPAVKRAPEANTPAAPAGRTPLYEVQGRPATEEPGERPAEDGNGTVAGADRDCPGGCDPLAWLKKLFMGDGSGDSPEPQGARAVRTGDGEMRNAAPVMETASVTATLAILPGEAAPGALRTPETVGRVWIAPFVDGGGVYREASWVRMVIAPSAWKLP